jgi:ribosomal protein S18 acetylase RimI-like enzyme
MRPRTDALSVDRKGTAMIRDADAADLKCMAAAMVRIQDTHAREFPDVYRQFSLEEARSHLLTLLEEPAAYLRVLEVGDKVVAHTVTQIQSRPKTLFEHARRVGYLAQIEVEPDCRRRGYGRLLLEDLQRIALAERVDRIVLDVWSFNQSAQIFYQATGFQNFGSKLTIVANKRP